MTDPNPLNEPDGTPEDVATLYSWANLHGAKYRDFSAARAQTREKARLRAEQALEDESRHGHGEAYSALEADVPVAEAPPLIEAGHPDTAPAPTSELVREDPLTHRETGTEAHPAESRWAELAAERAAHEAEEHITEHAAEQARYQAQIDADHAADQALRYAAERAAQLAAERVAQLEATHAAQLAELQAAQHAAEQAAKLAAEKAAQLEVEYAAERAARLAEEQAAEHAALRAQEEAAQHAAQQAAKEMEEQAARHAEEQAQIEAAQLAEQHQAEFAAQRAAELAARLEAQQAAEAAARLEAQRAAQEAERVAQEAQRWAQQEEAEKQAAQEAQKLAAQEAQQRAVQEEAEKLAAREAEEHAAREAAAQETAERAAHLAAEQAQAAHLAEQQVLQRAAEQAAARLAAMRAAEHAVEQATQQRVWQQPRLDHSPVRAPYETHNPLAQEESSMPPRNPWATPEAPETNGKPAWLSAERSDAPEQAAAPSPLPPATLPPAPEDTLQGSRDRLTSRWFALRGIFEAAPPPPEPIPAPTASRAPALAVFSLAGGVGKTSLVATLGRALSARGERVLLVDTAAFGLLPFFFGATDQRPGLLRTFNPPGMSSDAPIQMVTLDPEGLGSNGNGSDAGNDALTGEIGKFSRGVSRVIVDLATASGSTTRRIMRMAPLVLVPVIPDMNSVVSVSSIDAFFEHNSNPGGKPAMPFYVLNQFDASLPLHLDVREVLREQLAERLLQFALRRTPSMSEALAEGMTVMDYAPSSPLSEDFVTLAGWVKSISAPATASYRGVRWSER